MIRRLFWLTAGAVLGVTAYRRLAALGRYVPPALRPGELTRFAADVRDGMEIYAQRQARHRPPRPTLESRDRGVGGPGRTGTDELKDDR